MSYGSHRPQLTQVSLFFIWDLYLYSVIAVGKALKHINDTSFLNFENSI